MTSVVHCYPGGLLTSNVQYMLRHSPMLWLHSFEINHSGNSLVEKLDTDVLKSLTNLDPADEDIILGRFDLKIDLAIKKLKKKFLLMEEILLIWYLKLKKKNFRRRTGAVKMDTEM